MARKKKIEWYSDFLNEYWINFSLIEFNMFIKEKNTDPRNAAYLLLSQEVSEYAKKKWKRAAIKRYNINIRKFYRLIKRIKNNKDIWK